MFFAFAIVLLLGGCKKELTQSEKAWLEEYPQVEAQIVAPTFADSVYNIIDFGAVANDSTILNHGAINAAIDTCSLRGGGRVLVPEGVWYTGPITLKSNVDLHISDDAKLLFTSDLSQYPLVLTRWEGVDCYNYQPMIYSYRQQNIAITGKGIIDGGATLKDWWAMCGATRYGWEEGIVSQRIGRKILLEWNENGTPVDERIMGDGYGMRVPLINIYECENILIEDVTLLRSPFWVIHPLLSQNITVRRVHVENDGPNGDGCDPESCKNVLIDSCFFDTGDDCIAIKSGRNGDGRRWNTPSENIIVRNCYMKNGHGGVVIGSEISGGYKNLFVENCEMDSPNLDRVIRIKTNTCRGGVIENVYVRNVNVGQCREAVLKINLLYEQKELCCRDFPPVVRNVFLDNVTCKGSRFGVLVNSLEDQENVYNVAVNNCCFEGVTEPEGIEINGMTRDISFSDLYINDSLFNSAE